MENTIAYNEDEKIFDDEMRKIIIEREQDIKDNPDDWVDYKQAIEELQKGL